MNRQDKIILTEGEIWDFALKECGNTCAYSKDVTGIVRVFRDGELIEMVEKDDGR